MENLAHQERTLSSSFYSKVFSLFGLAIAVSGLGVFAAFNYFLPYFAATPALIYAVLIAEVLLIISSRWWSKTEPLNYFLFCVFAFLSGVSVMPVILSFGVEFGGYDIVYRALFTTTVTFLAMALVGYTTKKNLSGLGGFLLMGLIGMLIVALIGIFIPWGNTGEMIFSGAGVLLFSLFAMFDIQRLRYYPEDEYINAAINLYLDLFNLFIYILRFTGAISRD